MLYETQSHCDAEPQRICEQLGVSVSNFHDAFEITVQTGHGTNPPHADGVCAKYGAGKILDLTRQLCYDGEHCFV